MRIIFRDGKIREMPSATDYEVVGNLILLFDRQELTVAIVAGDAIKYIDFT